MSEWKRHRGSVKMPKCLVGKKYEAMRRDGTIAAYVNSWIHRGRDSDVMKYRIIPSEPAAEPAKPDYSKGFPEGTTAQDIGAKVGDKFVVVHETYAKEGEVVTLYYDDETTRPMFECKRGDFYLRWSELAPAPQKTAVELQAEEVGIPELVQYVEEIDTSPERVEKHEEVEQVQPNKYQRTIKGVTVDVYDVLDAFGVTCQARGHAIKKLLMAGQRGHKDEAQDLREAVQATERSIELVKG